MEKGGGKRGSSPLTVTRRCIENSQKLSPISGPPRRISGKSGVRDVRVKVVGLLLCPVAWLLL
jgi:hypothetical protein